MKTEEIKNIDYSTIVGLLNERNRPSGGIKTVQEACVNAFISSNKKVLEIGSNTGFTSVNINLLTGASVTGLDINELSLEKAREYATSLGSSVDFIKGSATNIPLDDNSFDVVWASNVTSFLKDKETAILEYFRVLKENGFLIFVPIYYKRSPSNELVDMVSKAVGAEIDVRSKEEWINLINISFNSGEIIYQSDYEYVDQVGRIESYTNNIFNESGILNEVNDKAALQQIKDTYKNFISLFNENLKYCGYSIIILQKRKCRDQEELFLTLKSV